MSPQEALDSRRRGMPSPRLTFKIASEQWEFEQVFQLNYKTFVEEIPQHQRNSSGVLVDKFHDENEYIICLRGRSLRGMVALRSRRPFSLDQKLEDLDSYLPNGKSVCEIRLLAVEREHRKGPILKGLLTMLGKYCIDNGYELAIISGTVRQLGLYKRLGFVPFGPLVGTPDALYQPMYGVPTLIKERFKAHFGATDAETRSPVNLLPGPVGISREVHEALSAPPVSHRSEQFIEDFNRTKQLLCQMVGVKRAEILLGSGTLANDVIAGQLSLKAGKGLVLSNGEFGDRLIDHARRARLSFEPVRVDWGQPLERETVDRAIERNPQAAWLWAVHCETSTGLLNDMEMLKEACAQSGLSLCVDCISSIGTLPVDLSGVDLASCVSGKGLGAFPGLSMVFYQSDVPTAPESLPRYLDLGIHAATDGVPFTISSNLVYALKVAVERVQTHQPFDHIVEVSTWIKGRLREMGLQIVAPDQHAAPAVITIALPRSISSADVGRRLEKDGYLLSCNSDYLLERNWIQICLMGESSEQDIAPLMDVLHGLLPVTSPS